VNKALGEPSVLVYNAAMFTPGVPTQLSRYDEAMIACGTAIERAPQYKDLLRLLTIGGL